MAESQEFSHTVVEKKQPGLSRREFLRLLMSLGPLIVATSAEGAVACLPPRIETVSLPKEELTFVLGRHGSSRLGIPGSKLPAEILKKIGEGKFDFLVLEGLHPIYSKPGKYLLPNPPDWRKIFLQRTDWYRDLAKVADSLLPIVGVEPVLRFLLNEPVLNESISLRLPGALGALGTAAVLSGRDKMDRREFLKRAIISVGSLWGQTMSLRLLVRSLSELFREEDKARKLFLELGIKLGKLHPEDITIRFRNFYIASQLLFLIEKFPHSKVGVIFGRHGELPRLVKTRDLPTISSEFKELQPKAIREALLEFPPVIQIYPSGRNKITEVLVNPYLSG